MSLDLFRDEAAEGIAALPRFSVSSPGVFEGFGYGTGMYTMQGLAKVGRAVDALGVVIPVLQDKITGGNATDKYLDEHEAVFQRAVDYWTPKPTEVGVAGQVTGNLLATLGTVLISPSLAVGVTQMGVAEDLVKQGVSPGKAVGVGTVQAAGLGTGIWMPVLGNTGFQRMVLGGAGFNVVQGAASRGASEVILKGTPAAGQFEAFNARDLTLDALLGFAFGGMAHLSPAQRAQGAEFMQRIRDIIKPSDVDAIATLRVAQHLNEDSFPGVPKDVSDIDAHTNRMRTAVDQLVRDEPMTLDDLPMPRFDPDVARQQAAEEVVTELRGYADEVRRELGLPEFKQPQTMPETALRTEDQPGAAALSPPPGKAEPADPSVIAETVAKQINDPLAIEATRYVSENPNAVVSMGNDVNGMPVVVPLREFYEKTLADAQQARADADLFEVAATCYLTRM